MDFNELANNVIGEITADRLLFLAAFLVTWSKRRVVQVGLKLRAGFLASYRWCLRNCVDLRIVYVWAAGTVVAFSYYGSAEATPLVVQTALVIPPMGFVAMVATDRVRRFRIWREGR